jgi:polar amino acid transport system substrate-binding protein
MKQILQNRKTGEIEVADVPPPVLQRGRVLVRTAASLISAGTERAAVDQNRKGLFGRALDRPELVKKTIRRAFDEGLASTVSSVRAKLDSAVALGYSAAGVVEAVGDEVSEFRIGDRVACAGLGFASHAEVLSVPRNLCAQLPEGVEFADGAYATLGAIALQGIRLAQPTLGESIVVIGLGLVGQLTAQLLCANGCRVYGVDPDDTRNDLARSFGIEASARDHQTATRIVEWTRGRGADAVLVTASSDSSEPIVLAGEVSRMKGRVVVVGQVGMDVPRDLFYRRELSLQVSMSYGPGRYDPDYEERGRDYPIAYVRWTEGRNIEAFVDMLARKLVNVERLTTHRFPVQDGARAYELITGKTNEPHLGVLLEYKAVMPRAIEKPRGASSSASTEFARAAPNVETEVRIGLIGAGAYAAGVLLPQFKAAGATFETVASASGISALNVRKQFGFESCASELDEVLSNPRVNLVVIATRHDSHASLARRALEGGRHVFVEKPVALSEDELYELTDVARSSTRRLMVGFNRRFSPLAVKAKELFEDRQTPLSFVYRINAGRLPREHWAHDEHEGGGRIVGEVCHFVDLMQFWTSSRVTRVFAEAVSAQDEQVGEDSVMVTLGFADGSNGTIAYLAEGDRALPKERIEIFGGGRTFVIDDFRGASIYRNGREEKLKSRAQDKGQAEAVRAACAVVLEGRPAPISLDELVNTTLATFRIRESIRTGKVVDV